MGIKKKLLQRYLPNQKVFSVIDHHYTSYLPILVGYIILLAVCRYIYTMISVFFTSSIVNRLFGLLGLVIYGRFVIDFLDLYLDGIVLTDTGLILFNWKGFFTYTTDSIQWGNIETITDNQNGILDMAFNKGDVSFNLVGESYAFKNITDPKAVSGEILKFKEEILTNKNGVDMSKFDILVETLGEVIIDYVQRDRLV